MESGLTNGRSLIIVPLPKKGDLQDCSNYRTISLISHPSKVLLKIILNRLKLQIEELLAEERAGFRKGPSSNFQRPYLMRKI